MDENGEKKKTIIKGPLGKILEDIQKLELRATLLVRRRDRTQLQLALAHLENVRDGLVRFEEGI